MWTDHLGHYIPLTWMSFGLDYVLWGMNPVGYHAQNVLFHALAAVLFFLLLHRLLLLARPGDDGRARVWIAAAGALFFALHPQRVESVAWITERRGMLSTCFLLLSVHAWLTSTSAGPGRRRWTWLAISCAAFAASLLSKAMGMTLPLALLILDVWPLRRYAREKPASILLEKIPFLLLSAAAMGVSAWAQNHAGAMYSRTEYPLVQSLAQPGYRISFYVLKTLVPVGLSPLYFYRPQLEVLHGLGYVLILGLTALALWKRRQAPAACVGWLIFGALIGPFAGLTQIGPHFASDRNTYMASMAAAGLFAALLTLPQDPRTRRTAGVAAAGVLALFAALSVRQTGVWRDSLALWNHVVELDPDVYFSRTKRGLSENDLGRWKEATEDFTRALELNPLFGEPWFGRGVARAGLGDHPGAILDFSRALDLGTRPSDTLAARGLSRSKIGDPAGAIADCNQAVRLDPTSAQPLTLRGQLRHTLGDYAGAIADYSQALQLAPESPSVHYHRGLSRSRAGRSAEAIADFTRALELRPAYPEALAQRGAARAVANDPGGALTDLTESLRLKPDPGILLMRASVRAVQGDFHGATADCTQAIEMNPASPDAWSRRGAALLETGDRAGAVRDLTRALEIAPPGWPSRRPTEELLQKARQ